MNAPADIQDAEGTYQPPVDGWCCFHCGERFNVAMQGSWQAAKDAAIEHFGHDPRWTVACVERGQLRPQQIYRRMRLAELKLAEIAADAEELDDLRVLTFTQGTELTELRSKVETLEGLLLIEQLRFREAR